jgi:hypothetical protein
MLEFYRWVTYSHKESTVVRSTVQYLQWNVLSKCSGILYTVVPLKIHPPKVSAPLSKVPLIDDKIVRYQSVCQSLVTSYGSMSADPSDLECQKLSIHYCWIATQAAIHQHTVVQSCHYWKHRLQELCHSGDLQLFSTILLVFISIFIVHASSGYLQHCTSGHFLF